MSGRRKEKLYSIYRPNTGLQQRAESLEKVKSTYKKASLLTVDIMLLIKNADKMLC